MSDILNSAGIDVGVMLIVLLLLEIGLVIAVFALMTRVRRLNAKYTSFMKGQSGGSLERDITQKVAKIEKYAKNLGTLDGTLNQIRDVQAQSVHKYGIVKYDAFEDVGGKLSFALALLNESDSGFVLNAVHSKENCFLYLKEIVKGESYIMLSNEEVEALRAARRYGNDEILDE